MSRSASLSLRKAIYQALIKDPLLQGKIGITAIYDEAPGRMDPPYIAFGPVIARDWSTSQEAGEEHEVILHCWSMQPGTSHVLDLAAQVIRICQAATFQLESHHLVLMTYLGTETRRDNKGRYALAAVRFRALTEALI